MIRWSEAPQGSEEWLAIRRGRVTGSMFRVARERTGGLDEKQAAYVNAMKAGSTEAQARAIAGYQKAPTADAVRRALAGERVDEPSKAALSYAMDTARQRCGGTAPDAFVTQAMRFGTEQEPAARLAYEDLTGNLVEQVGFAYTDDGKFGVSVDGLVDDDGMIEIKTLVSSDVLFSTMVDGDISEYLDQTRGGLWLLGRKWCDLCLWAPDLPTGKLKVIRIHRDEDAIEALEDDLMAFERMVSEYEAALRKAMAPSAPVPETAASGKPAADLDAPWDMSSVGVTPKPALEPTF